MRFLFILIIVAFAGACNQVHHSDDFDRTELQVITTKIDSLVNESDNYYSSINFNDSLFDSYLLAAFEFANENNLYAKQIEILRKVGKRFRNISEFGIALFFYQKSLEIANQIEDERLKAYIKADMAVVFRRIDDNAKALSLHFQTLEWAESVQDTFLILTSYNGIGNVYISYKNMPKAIDYFHRSLNLIKNGYSNKLSEAINTNNIGEAWLAIGNSDSALYYVHKSYDINREMGSKLGQAICENGLGDIYEHLNNYNKAIEHYNESLRLNREVGNLIYIAGTLRNLGKAYLMLGNYNLAEQFLLEALKIAKEIGTKSNIVQTLSNLSELYRKSGKKDLALSFLDEAMVYKDTITDEVSRLNSEGMNALYKTEKQEREILILKQKDELSQLTLKRQRWLFISTIIIILGGLIFSVYAIYQRRAVLRYTRQIQIQNQNIRDSIRYAQKIQSAMLPDINLIKSRIEDSFVLFKPRDFVSGDFYWFAVKDNLTIIAVADCTGHGVPGALMSMLGMAFLNEIVNREGITQPHLILNRLREQVITQLNQKGNIEDSKDGIDISICAINHDTMQLNFAGAYTPLYIVRNDELIQIKPDTMPIGYHPKKDYSFSVKEFELRKGDCLYSSSDGYHDQFGGDGGTKFMIKNMKDLFLKIHKLSMDDQKSQLEIALNNWKGNYEQVDDIIIVGIRI